MLYFIFQCCNFSFRQSDILKNLFPSLIIFFYIKDNKSATFFRCGGHARPTIYIPSYIHIKDTFRGKMSLSEKTVSNYPIGRRTGGQAGNLAIS